MDNKQFNLKQYDLVTIKTTKNVKYLVAPDENEVKPHGVWSVIGIVNKDNVLVCKDGATCLLPINDVTLVAEYSIDKVINKITEITENKNNGQENNENNENKDDE